MFITFEGIEGCGKTTQIKRFSNRLEGEGVSFIRTLEPGGTDIGREIRKILLDSKNTTITPLAELILYIADRAQHCEETIEPALAQGKWVVCDRFFDATVAYQGFARGQDRDLIRSLNKMATGNIHPDITLLLDCPVEIGLKRAISRNENGEDPGQDRFEQEKMEFHRLVRQGYLSLAESEPERFRIIDASLPEDDVEKAILKEINPFIKK